MYFVDNIVAKIITQSYVRHCLVYDGGMKFILCYIIYSMAVKITYTQTTLDDLLLTGNDLTNG